MSNRREFLVASILPLLPGIHAGTGCDQRIKWIHRRVLNAFDTGASLRPEPYTTTFIGASTHIADVDVLLAEFQHDVAELKRGREYRITTRVTKDHVAVLAAPLSWVDIVHPLVRCWRLSDVRKL